MIIQRFLCIYSFVYPCGYEGYHSQPVSNSMITLNIKKDLFMNDTSVHGYFFRFVLYIAVTINLSFFSHFLSLSPYCMATSL